MSFTDFPVTAAFAHQDARSGFEVVYFDSRDHGCSIDGSTAAVEDGQTWVVDYTISLDPAGCTRNARVTSRARAGSHSVELETDGVGRWTINGQAASHLDGCLDVDLESSAVTNSLPVRRMSLATGERAEAPAAYVRAIDLSVERLAQTYRRASLMKDRARATTTPHRHSSSAAASSTTSRVWSLAIRELPSASCDRAVDSGSTGRVAGKHCGQGDRLPRPVAAV